MVVGVPAVTAAASLHHVAVVVVGVAAAPGPGRHDVGGVLEAVGENVRRRFAQGLGDSMGAAAAAITVAQAVLAQQVAQGVVAEIPPVGADTVVGGDAGQAVEQVIFGGCLLFHSSSDFHLIADAGRVAAGPVVVKSAPERWKSTVAARKLWEYGCIPFDWHRNWKLFRGNINLWVSSIISSLC